MVEDELKRNVLSRICGQLGGKISHSFRINWRRYFLATSYFALLFVSSLYFRGLYTILVLGLCVHAARRTAMATEGCDCGRVCTLLSYAYAIIPGFSMLHLLSLKNSADFIVWLSLLLVAIKTSIYIFESVFEGRILSEKLHPTKTSLGFLGSLLVSVPIGLVSSLFLKQRLIRFTAVNVFMAVLVHVQDIMGYGLGKYLDPGGEDLFIVNYTNLALLTSFLVFLIIFKLIGA
ncbi:MAG: hypothetical protein LBB24_01030 [Rickettsiales bacterium]|jgi:CDP-diglyceride synthetase|nr:hypothetical protein [Rickettsiales bacterium]